MRASVSPGRTVCVIGRFAAGGGPGCGCRGWACGSGRCGTSGPVEVAGARGGVGRGDGGGGAAGSLGGSPTGVVGTAGSGPADCVATTAAITAAATGTA